MYVLMKTIRNFKHWNTVFAFECWIWPFLKIVIIFIIFFSSFFPNIGRIHYIYLISSIYYVIIVCK